MWNSVIFCKAQNHNYPKFVKFVRCFYGGMNIGFYVYMFLG